MRFITEFKVPESAFAHNQNFKHKDYIPEKRHLSEVKLGNMLAESFGWQNPVNHNLDHHRLEIEAFPMDKWIEFKKELSSLINGLNNGDYNKICSLISELESFGKPAGATKEL